ncbi:hypothetical protein BGZ94_008051 [Podila epigama]|nr:hypothetical protein BGZ94_008051 [Podila epigama]
MTTPTSFNTIKRPIADDVRPSSSSHSTTRPTDNTNHQQRQDHHHAIDLNIERNHRTLPLPKTSSTYPSIPRFVPVPNRMSGNYTPPGNATPNGSTTPFLGRRPGTSSASSSPPGTPPSGLRNHYLNAAFQRHHHHQFYSLASAPGSTSSFQQHQQQQQHQQRPSISISTPPHAASLPRLQIPEPVAFGTSSSSSSNPPPPQRSYSADQLIIMEPEITITSPGGSNATEHHVMTLQRALSNLVSQNEHRLEEQDEEDEFVEGDPIMMKSAKKTIEQSTSSSSSSSSPSPPSATPSGTSTPPPETSSPSHGKKKGVTKFPKIVIDRLDPATAAALTTTTTTTTDAPTGTGTTNDTLSRSRNSSAGSSDTTLTELNEKAAATSENVAAKKQGATTITIGATPVPIRETNTVASVFPNSSANVNTNPADDMTRQPSKAGVLSNLLKLQGIGRPHKSTSSKPRKEKKKPKRPSMYIRSANNSNASLNTKSVFTTYPRLPATTPTQSTFAPGTMSNFYQPQAGNKGSGSVSQRNSIHMETFFANTFSAAPSPMPSPTQSLSGGELTPGAGGSYFPGPSKGGSNGLSTEEQLRITMAVADILERQDYILRLAKSMIKYGAPSHRLEDAIDHSARHLELNLQCVYLPNVMIVAFTDYETHTSETHLLKMSADLDMFKCALVHQVHKMVTHSSMPIEEAIMKLEAINSEPDANPRWATILAYATAGLCTAPMFFNGSWIDASVAFVVGGAVGMMVWLAEKVPSYSHICEITMSVVVAFVAEALHSQVNCGAAIKLAGIVIILPGYTITCAILELSSRHIISGSVRLFYAVVFSLLLGYGLTIGASLWHLFEPASSSSTPSSGATSCTPTLDPKWNIMFVPLFAISLNIWLKAHPRQWFLATVLSIIGYTVSYTSSVYGGAKTEVSSALAAFAIGFCGNVYQRLTRQLSFQAVVCAVFFLVPGSIGLKGAIAWFSDDISAGVNFALQMVVTAIAISVGLFASALVVYPMGKSRSAQMTF